MSTPEEPTTEGPLLPRLLAVHEVVTDLRVVVALLDGAFDVHAAPTAPDALIAARRESYDVVVADADLVGGIGVFHRSMSEAALRIGERTIYLVGERAPAPLELLCRLPNPWIPWPAMADRLRSLALQVLRVRGRLTPIARAADERRLRGKK